MLRKPTVDTPFHIDYTWFERSGEDLRLIILNQLPAEIREKMSQQSGESVTIDYVDPVTAEVTQLDELGAALREAARDANFISPHTPVVDSVFRVFLANGNEPLTPAQLEERIGKSAATILKTLSNGTVVYKGIRPV
jgi:hypothetical protein